MLVLSTISPTMWFSTLLTILVTLLCSSSTCLLSLMFLLFLAFSLNRWASTAWPLRERVLSFFRAKQLMTLCLVFSFVLWSLILLLSPQSGDFHSVLLETLGSAKVPLGRSRRASGQETSHIPATARATTLASNSPLSFCMEFHLKQLFWGKKWS